MRQKKVISIKQYLKSCSLPFYRNIKTENIVTKNIFFLLIIFLGSNCNNETNLKWGKIKENTPIKKVVNDGKTNKATIRDTIWLFKKNKKFVYYFRYKEIWNQDTSNLNLSSKLYWGNETSKFETEKMLGFYALQSSRFEKIVDNVIFIESSEGNGYASNSHFVLPLDKNRHYFEMYQMSLFFPKNNLIIYPGPSKAEFLVVINLTTKKKFVISENNVCDETNYYISFKKIKLISKNLLIEWYTSEDCQHNCSRRIITLPEELF